MSREIGMRSIANKRANLLYQKVKKILFIFLNINIFEGRKHEGEGKTKGAF